MAQTLVAAQLIEQARKATGLERFDSESFREGLDVFLADVNACEYTESGMQRLVVEGDGVEGRKAHAPMMTDAAR